MYTATKPSKRSPHRVFIENDTAILEVKRNGLFYIYEIEDNGDHKLLCTNKNPYKPELGQEEEFYYMDRMTSDAMRKLLLLNDNFDKEEIAENLKKNIIEKINNCYDWVDFDTDMHNILAETIDCLHQNYLFSEEMDDLEKFESFKRFCDDFFYEKESTLTEQELLEANRIINLTIKELIKKDN